MAGRRRALANDDPRLTPFARTLRALIDARRLSDTRLCQIAGLPPSTLSRWITFTRRPTNVALLLDTAAAMELTRAEAEDLLSKAGYDLDAVLRYRRHDPRIAAVAIRWTLPDGSHTTTPFSPDGASADARPVASRRTGDTVDAGASDNSEQR